MLDQLSEVHVRADHHNLLQNSHHLAGLALPRHRARYRELIILVRRALHPWPARQPSNVAVMAILEPPVLSTARTSA